MPTNVSYADDVIIFSATVRRATLRDELRRLDLQKQAIDAAYDDAMEFGLHYSVYASLAAATPAGSLTVDGQARPWPPPFEDVVDALPKQVLDQWLGRVYELNPDWKPDLPAEGEAEEKKDAGPPVSEQ